MANIMSLKDIVNRPSRSSFDKSKKINFTAKAGELLPVVCEEVLPGDKWRIDLKTFTRTQPLNTAAFARCREYYDFYFVPYEQLWSRMDSVLVQMKYAASHATQFGKPLVLNGDFPSISAQDLATLLSSDVSVYLPGGYSVNMGLAKLLQYLGYPDMYDYALNKSVSGTVQPKASYSDDPLLSNDVYNIFPLLAYQKIYYDWFSDSQWEVRDPTSFNVDYMKGNGDTDLGTVIGQNIVANATTFYQTIGQLRYSNYQKDLFHGLLPNSQYGDVASYSPLTLSDDKGQLTVSENKVPSIQLNLWLAGRDNELSILALRQLEFLQKYKEVAASGKQDYKSQIEKHWNVSGSNLTSDLCQWLGGLVNDLNIGEVVNSNITGDFAAQIAGKGTFSGDKTVEFEAQNQYGLIMCIYHCVPQLDYVTPMTSPFNLKTNASDLAIPEFDKAGMELVPLSYLLNCRKSLAPSTTVLKPLLGYAPRYIDYKTSVDTSIGAFRTTLKNWVVPFDASSMMLYGVTDNTDGIPQPLSDNTTNLTYLFFKCIPSVMDSIFSVAADSTIDTDQFLCQCFAKMFVVRNLDANGLPY